MTETRKLKNEEFFEHLKGKKEELKRTKARREYLINKFKLTKARANDIAKRV